MAPRSSSPTTWNEIFADIYADHGDCAVEALGHGVLLCLWSPLPDSSLAGQEHGQTIPLADIGRLQPNNFWSAGSSWNSSCNVPVYQFALDWCAKGKRRVALAG